MCQILIGSVRPAVYETHGRSRGGRRGSEHGLCPGAAQCHTLYDSFTGLAGSALATTGGMIRGVAAYLGTVILQIVMLVRFKKKAAEFCAMSLLPEESAANA